MNLTAWLNTLTSNFKSRSATEQMRLSIYWGTLAVAALVLGFSVYYAQTIPQSIRSDIRLSLTERPWVDSLIVVDGRDVYLRGDIEPGSGLDVEMDLIAAVSGVRSVTNAVNEQPKPSAHMVLSRHDNGIVLGGQMSGDILEMILPKLEVGFFEDNLKDRVQIDDRMGRPLWLDGMDQSLEAIQQLQEFELHGWRDQLLISGVAQNHKLRREVGYSIPVSLISKVRVTNQLRLPVAANFPDFQIQSDWQGTAIRGRLPSALTRDRLVEAVKQSFAVRKVTLDVDVDDNLFGDSRIEKLITILPSLSGVRDLNLQSTGKGYVVWGRLDSAAQLGKFIHARNQAGLEQVIDNQIRVSRGETASRIALFSDGQRAVVEGILPSIGVRQTIFNALNKVLGVDEVLDMTSVEPNVTSDLWMDNWSRILQLLPGSVVGIAINENTVLVTGNAETEDMVMEIDRYLASCLPHLEHLNWTTTIH